MYRTLVRTGDDLRCRSLGERGTSALGPRPSLLHGLFPLLGTLILLAPPYYQFNPLPEYPIQLGNWFAVAWLAAGLVALVYLVARRPRAIAAASEVFIDREQAG